MEAFQSDESSGEILGKLYWNVDRINKIVNSLNDIFNSVFWGTSGTVLWNSSSAFNNEDYSDYIHQRCCKEGHSKIPPVIENFRTPCRRSQNLSRKIDMFTWIFLEANFGDFFWMVLALIIRFITTITGY